MPYAEIFSGYGSPATRLLFVCLRFADSLKIYHKTTINAKMPKVEIDNNTIIIAPTMFPIVKKL
jgi:hypothetical protein